MTAETPTAFDLRHMALRNAIYHQNRMRVLDWWNRLATFLTLVLGTAVAGDLGKYLAGTHQTGAQGDSTDPTTLWLGGIVAAIGAAQLVMDFGGRARLHQTLHRDFTRLLAKMMEDSDPSEKDRLLWQAEIVRIGADEPPTKRAADTVAYNEASDTLGADPAHRLVVPWWMFLTQHLFSHTGYRFETVSERAERKKKPH
jgi:hypothetical protein